MLGCNAVRAAFTSVISRSCRIRDRDVEIVRLLSTACNVRQSDVPHDPPDPHDPRNATISLASPVFGVWGANTGVGKTLISAGLASAFQQQQVPATVIAAWQVYAL
jgi:predicted GTPase